jgi:anti-sigma factor RsiW
MRRHHDVHLTREELLSFIDGELPPHRTARATAHLTSCATCRARRDRIDNTLGLVTSGYRKDVAAGELASSRQTLHVSLTQTRRQMDRFTRTLRESWHAVTPAWALVTAVAAIALFAMELRPTSTSGFEIVAAAEAGALPIASLTPGATVPLEAAELCASRRGPQQHRLPASIRQGVLRKYRMEHLAPSEYELDFLITPELGGSAEPANLWPERYQQPVWNARVKDELEELLPRLVCAGRLRLDVAQRDIATDWIAAYRKYFHTNAPLRLNAAGLTSDRDEIVFDEPAGAPVLALTMVPPVSSQRSAVSR